MNTLEDLLAIEILKSDERKFDGILDIETGGVVEIQPKGKPYIGGTDLVTLSQKKELSTRPETVRDILEGK